MNRPLLYKDIRLYTFLGIIAFLFVHHFYGYFGHYGFDDIMGYGYYGKKWADGHLFFINEDFFSYRWGFISLTGFFYALFGMSDDTSAIAPSLVLLGTVLLIFKVLRHHVAFVGALAAILYALDNWTMYYSDKLMPDTSVALATFASFVLIANYRFENDGKNPFKHALGLSLILIWAYTAKESVLLLFPVYFSLMLLDLFQKRHSVFWVYTVFCCALMGILYLFVTYLITGDPLMRFHAIEVGLSDNLGTGRSFSFCNYAIQPWSALLYRIGFEMIFKFMATGMMITLLLGLVASFKYKLSEIFKNNTVETYWVLVLLLSLLSSNFMTTSYKAYLPICPDIRHFLFLVPLAVVVGVPVLVNFLQKKELAFPFVMFSLLITVLAFWADAGNFKWIYLALVGLFLLRLALPNHRFIAPIMASIIVLLALAPATSSMKSASSNSYIEQREVIYNYLKNKPHKSLVVTNVIQKHFGQYLLEFDENALTKFYDYSVIDTLFFPPDAAIYVLANGETRFMSNFDYNDLPRCIKDCYEGKQPPSIETVYYSEAVALYKLHQPQLLKAGK